MAAGAASPDKPGRQFPTIACDPGYFPFNAVNAGYATVNGHDLTVEFWWNSDDVDMDWLKAR
ncbi:hypothetical protein K3U94_19970 [Mycolicibacter heraklionensis]|uniref:Uncharacterized protein n=1 Tax=Mycolicibacter heraklionensis TaxID=512402 RepID=A0A9X7ZE11_9MYCO|nr:hypothetical protein [Mycolicibacter heraklionensis]QZA07206.1 hypothetical protein K3U94_19970 [Mycolicibacter heraklionensis]